MKQLLFLFFIPFLWGCQKYEEISNTQLNVNGEWRIVSVTPTYESTITNSIQVSNSDFYALSPFVVVSNNTTNNTTTHTNSHNKAFNLNFFLNETCKDAMNIGEFVDSLKIQLSDLEKVGEAGYIEGISNIIVKNLKELDVTKRPVHCTDKKRETVYIKDADKWEKDEDKSQMHKLIKRVASKNVKMFDKYREAHPDCKQYHSKHNDIYNKNKLSYILNYITSLNGFNYLNNIYKINCLENKITNLFIE